MLYSLLSTAFQHQRDVKEQWSCWNGKTHNINMKIYASFNFAPLPLSPAGKFKIGRIQDGTKPLNVTVKGQISQGVKMHIYMQHRLQADSNSWSAVDMIDTLTTELS